jgi:putative oxidoreductase
MIKKMFATQNDIGTLIARLTVGLVMLPHGAQKMLGLFGGYGFSGTMTAFTEQMQIPWIIAFLVIIGEFLGSLGLIFGFLSRISAFGIISIMMGAIFIGHLSHGFFMNWYGNQKGEGIEYHLLMIGLALIVLIKGGGSFAVDKKLS